MSPEDQNIPKQYDVNPSGKYAILLLEIPVGFKQGFASYIVTSMLVEIPEGFSSYFDLFGKTFHRTFLEEFHRIHEKEFHRGGPASKKRSSARPAGSRRALRARGSASRPPRLPLARPLITLYVEISGLDAFFHLCFLARARTSKLYIRVGDGSANKKLLVQKNAPDLRDIENEPGRSKNTQKLRCKSFRKVRYFAIRNPRRI